MLCYHCFHCYAISFLVSNICPNHALVNRQLDRILALNFNPTSQTFLMDAGFTTEGGDINPWVKK